MGSQPAKNALFEKYDQDELIGTEDQIVVVDRQIKVPRCQSEYFQDQDINESWTPKSVVCKPKTVIITEDKECIELQIKVKNTPENAKFLKFLAKQVQSYQNHAQFSTDFSSQKSVSSILKRVPHNNTVDLDQSLRNISMPMHSPPKTVQFDLDEKKSHKSNRTKRMKDLRILGLIGSPVQKSRFRDAQL